MGEQSRRITRLATGLSYLQPALLEGLSRGHWHETCDPEILAMIGRWSTWKRFPDALHGEHLEAPIGPGLYEVAHAPTGEQVAFGSTPNVAEALANLIPSPNKRGWPFFRRAASNRFPREELEYRTWSAGTVSEAKLAAGHMLGQRAAMIRRFSPTRN